jgi:hypothetical protein
VWHFLTVSCSFIFLSSFDLYSLICKIVFVDGKFILNITNGFFKYMIKHKPVVCVQKPKRSFSLILLLLCSILLLSSFKASVNNLILTLKLLYLLQNSKKFSIFPEKLNHFWGVWFLDPNHRFVFYHIPFFINKIYFISRFQQ